MVLLVFGYMIIVNNFPIITEKENIIKLLHLKITLMRTITTFVIMILEICFKVINNCKTSVS